MLAGRDFDKSYGSDHLTGYIVNELACKALGWNSPEEALGKTMARGGKQGNVVDVIKNFHFGYRIAGIAARCGMVWFFAVGSAKFFIASALCFLTTNPAFLFHAAKIRQVFIL